MTKREVERLSKAEIRRQFPLSAQLDGWFFRVQEESVGHYHAEGTDLWGRTVSRHGSDPDEALSECVQDARSIVAQVEEDAI